MISNDLLRRYWRIPVVGLLAAALAFLASYLVYPTYESSTRLLVHGRDATFLSSTGEDLAAQPGVVDASLSQALLSTYSGIATGRNVAVAVTDELALDKKPESTSPYAAVAQAFAWMYRCSRAFVTAGFCAPVDAHEQAVLEVQEGITAAPAGTNGGESAGQPGSYVLEVMASGGSPAEAKAVTDAVADQLVKTSNDRFQNDAAKAVASLERQVEIAEKELRASTQATARYQTENGISAADVKAALSAATLETVRESLITARADLADTEAQLASVELSLRQVPRTERSKETIVTGRSSTDVSRNGTSTVYSELTAKQSTLRADEAGLQARVNRLSRQVRDAKPLAGNRTAADLVVLQERTDLAMGNLRELTAKLQQAKSNSAQGAVDLSRLDPASEPTYPMKPKRYIYLALGLLIGALAGAALTARAQGGPVAAGEDADGPPADHEDVAVVAPRTNGHSIPAPADHDTLDLILSGHSVGPGVPQNGDRHP